MTVEAPAEIVRLRTALRDLVALSIIPVAWVGRDPPAIAAGLADVLVESMHLGFGFVRLCDPNSGAAVEAARGDAWSGFPAWMQGRLTVAGPLGRAEIIVNVGSGSWPCRGIVIPIGVNAEGGLVAAACDRTDFPTEIDQLLLSVAANHAAAACQNSRLIHERRTAEEALRKSEHALRQAGEELEQKVTERTAQLKESEQRWSAVFENNPTMYFMVAPHGAVLQVNPFGAEQLGYTVDELVGRSVLTVFHEPDRQAVQEHLAGCLKQLGRTMTWELRKVRKDGTMLWVRETARAVWLGSDEPVVLVACEDITERKRVEETLRKTQSELTHVARVATLGELTASIAHEINQPLGAIVNNAGACLRWLTAQNLEEVRQSIERVIKDGHRASQIISRIRALVRKASPQKDAMDINETILEVLALTRNEVEAHGVAVQNRLSDDVPAVLGDRIQLQQVLVNLIMNAVEAMGGTVDGPRSLVIGSTRHDAEHILVAVQDSGPGVDPAHLNHVFDAFYSTKPRGLGMGLAISRSIIEAHGGRLWATANESRGATFQFTLPVGGDRRYD